MKRLKIDEGLEFGLTVALGLVVMVIMACAAGAVAAPAATPLPTKTPMLIFTVTPAPEPARAPVPTPVADPLRQELERGVEVCLLTQHQYLATIPVGKRVGSISFHWSVVGPAAVNIHTIRVAKETWLSLVGYETFHFVSTYELTRNVWVDITIDGQRMMFRPTVKDCPPPLPMPGSSA